MLKVVQFKECLLKRRTATRVVGLTVDWLAARGLGTPHNSEARVRKLLTCKVFGTSVMLYPSKQINHPRTFLMTHQTPSLTLLREGIKKKVDSTPDANCLSRTHVNIRTPACHPVIGSGVTKNSLCKRNPSSIELRLLSHLPHL